MSNECKSEENAAKSSGSDLISWVDPVEAERESKIRSVKRLLNRRRSLEDVGNAGRSCAVYGNVGYSNSDVELRKRYEKSDVVTPSAVVALHEAGPYLSGIRCVQRNGDEKTSLHHRPAFRSSFSVSIDEYRSDSSSSLKDSCLASKLLHDFDPFSSLGDTKQIRADAAMENSGASFSHSDPKFVLKTNCNNDKGPRYKEVKKVPPLEDPGVSMSFDLKPMRLIKFTPHWLASLHNLVESIRNTSSSDRFRGLVISRRLKGLKLSLSSVKLLVYVDEVPGDPLKFTCDPSSTVEQVVMCILYSLPSEMKTLPLDQYTLKVCSICRTL
ncbi:unnamed protein product [Soboliphyme baturini]|uniref:PI3K-RBD domain-containing protein n=1 Tax=Soboliphyme baturini TaxID=241478 RepID=A0A183J8W3_9BILA|nr:unnamed protein product [Soboliphyme baturini]